MRRFNCHCCHLFLFFVIKAHKALKLAGQQDFSYLKSEKDVKWMLNLWGDVRCVNPLTIIFLTVNYAFTCRVGELCTL